MLFLGGLAALAPVATDLALPALVDIAHALETTSSVAGLTLSLFMLGFALSPFFYGPMSDRYGRRPALLLGLAIFALGSALTTFATSPSMLLAARVVQGAGAGAGMTLVFAVIRDRFEGREAQQRLALITVVINLAPIVAPAVGSGLLALWGWRGIYAVIMAFGVALLGLTWLAFAETHAPLPKGTAPKRSDNVYMRLFRHAQVRGHVITNGLGFAWMFSYVAGSPLVLVGLWHLAPWLYALMFACTGAGIVVGATLNGWMTRRGVRGEAVLFGGIILAILSSALLIALTLTNHATVFTAMPLLVLATCSFGLAAPSATHGAMAPLPQLAGATGGLLTSVQMLMGAAGSSVVVLLFPGFGLLAMAVVMFGAAILAAVIYFPLYRVHALTAA